MDGDGNALPRNQQDSVTKTFLKAARSHLVYPGMAEVTQSIVGAADQTLAREMATSCIGEGR